MNIEKTAENLKAYGYKAEIFENKEEAAQFICKKLKNEIIGFGGSKTVEEIGLYEMLQKKNTPLWHWKNTGVKEDSAKYTSYITSANAVSESGELVNIDGSGNRLAGSLYGSKKLFFIVGENKIVPT
ncbi:MAG: lactate utilization protein, partial [Oscillospiraceae bacterium]